MEATFGCSLENGARVPRSYLVPIEFNRLPVMIVHTMIGSLPRDGLSRKLRVPFLASPAPARFGIEKGTVNLAPEG